MNKSSFLIGVISILFCLHAKGENPDSINVTRENLNKKRAMILASKELKTESKIERLLKLGAWNDAFLLIKADKSPNIEMKLLYADYLLLNNDFKKADSLVSAVLERKKENVKALLLKAQLEIQAWKLPEAEKTCQAITLLKDKPFYDKAMLLMGRAQLLQKQYDNAFKIAKEIETQFPNNAEAWLLESDVLFWTQKPDQAEAPLKKSLELDPYNADARFNYGYAIWRRVDATQLKAMAAQWDLALAINPLHFQTHWHWGNGHTQLTYADYAQKEDEQVRKELAPADDLIRSHKIQEAIDYSRTIEKKYPHSVLPAMLRGSAYYMAFDMKRSTRLDSAQAIFLQILSKKQHFGPAHNGLAAVIKSKRIPYYAAFDSIENALKTLTIKDTKNFERVFPDVNYYPGETVKKWAWTQLYTSSAYFPLLSKQNKTFAIPPLHIDLATALHDNFYRQATTFDNRQWMDIRGVGSGAAGIEYVERGAYQERNVLLHEFMHLIHLNVLTDAETRKIRELYYKAMQENRMLDYYSANNEHEYFAQAYPAYFEAVKVHPLDFKSMNTTADLKTKDPGMFAFIDNLTKKEKNALSGNASAMKSNWAQSYLNLSLLATDKNRAAKLLDTALNYDSNYSPALVAYADLKIASGDFTAAQQYLQTAQSLNAQYSPLLVSKAKLLQAQAEKGLISPAESISNQTQLYQKALQIEPDPMVKAEIISAMEDFYKKNGLVADAFFTAENYAKSAPTTSTYLRDIRDEQVAYAALLKAGLGYNDAVEVLRKQVQQKPQNYDLRGQFADALAANKSYDEAIANLQSVQKILTASGSERADFTLKIAEYYYWEAETDSAAILIKPLLNGKPMINGNQTRLIRLLANLNQTSKAEELFAALPPAKDNFEKADYYYTEAKIRESKALMEEASQDYKKVIELNPYHFNAVFDLIKFYRTAGFTKEANAVYDKLINLKMKPGPAFR
ncbi:tetratricopeptide repeat protein [Solitalea koreensis]|uniref:Tetratricopeptide repeat-containing protein n=1 Tax=Solitalea koreensis TaxID=543615 RepID=A0A521C3E3_9SPHI|nr:tetratricopeptide repeat protein [Solitalea koreensis]SMO54006.1 Tetratricopeptide repeat-containing protein [Solitalea koreensis]